MDLHGLHSDLVLYHTDFQSKTPFISPNPFSFGASWNQIRVHISGNVLQFYPQPEAMAVLFGKHYGNHGNHQNSVVSLTFMHAHT